MKAVHYNKSGILEHDCSCSYTEFAKEWGYNKHRKAVIGQTKTGLLRLKSFGIKTVKLGGSFASTKDKPNDIDGVFDVSECAKDKLQDLADFIENQDQYKLDLYFSGTKTKLTNKTHESFFRRGRNGEVRGLIVLDLSTLKE